MWQSLFQHFCKCSLFNQSAQTFTKQFNLAHTIFHIFHGKTNLIQLNTEQIFKHPFMETQTVKSRIFTSPDEAFLTK